jgi:GT2 family glycosyltransferase
MPSASSSPGADVVIVNWNSGQGLAELLGDLGRQQGIQLDVTVVDNGSTDGSLERVAPERTIRTGANLGYTGGSNAGFRTLGPQRPVLLINPDVRLPDPATVATLVRLLEQQPRLAALVPTIRSSEGMIEYRDSVVDPDRAVALHRETNVSGWPDATPPVKELSWVDGAAMLFRPDALERIGLFDERFFLFYEEVDWCLRATRDGWTVGIATGVSIAHARSSSFADATKGSYYYWRNLYLLCDVHARRRLSWRLRWTLRLAGFCLQRGHLRGGQSAQALRGARDALRGSYGAGPEDR